MCGIRIAEDDSPYCYECEQDLHYDYDDDDYAELDDNYQEYEW